MKANIHYGIIEGCKKPSLYKPGAEILLHAFKLRPEFETTPHEDPQRTIRWDEIDSETGEIVGERTTTGYVEYDTGCTLVDQSGQVRVKNVRASCNNYEAKYRSLSPHDIKNTLEKMSEIRSLIAATLIGVAGSEIFTQDIEGLPALVNGGNGGNGGNGSNHPSTPGQGEHKENGGHDEQVRMATAKQVSYLKSEIAKRKINEQAFFARYAEYFKTWDTIPFAVVNEILKWVREQK